MTIDATGSRNDAKIRGSIVVVAKCPIPGKSKTRLIPLLGEMGSVRLAKSMLSDVLKTIDVCLELKFVRKILVYAPGTNDGLERMTSIFDELGLKLTPAASELDPEVNHGDETWRLLPMTSSDSGKELKSHDLGAKLEDSLVRVRELNPDQRQYGVVFLGMDAPTLPLDDIVEGLKRAATEEKSPSRGCATICPAMDGGYAMLCVPPTAEPSKTFSRMYWSHSLTGMSQIKALTDQGIHTVVGKIVRDIDDARDVQELYQLLLKNQQDEANPKSEPKNLEYPGGLCPSMNNGNDVGVTSSHSVCHYTRLALAEVDFQAKGFIENEENT